MKHVTREQLAGIEGWKPEREDKQGRFVTWRSPAGVLCHSNVLPTYDSADDLLRVYFNLRYKAKRIVDMMILSGSNLLVQQGLDIIQHVLMILTTTEGQERFAGYIIEATKEEGNVR
jgi:hypothetical protein